MAWNLRKSKIVIVSVETEDRGTCVDIFQREDDTFGFEEYRRDFEDQLGWFPIGVYSHRIFKNRSDAIEAACKKIKWFSDFCYKKNGVEWEQFLKDNLSIKSEGRIIWGINI